MRVLLAALVLGLAPLAGCGNTCTLKACEADLTFHMRDADGAILPYFTGVLTLGGRSVTFTCNGISASQGSQFVCGDPGDVVVFGFAADGGHYDLKLTDRATGAVYHGPLSPTFDTVKDFNGVGCGSCSTGVVTVTVPKS
jgi:hypothetical protein